MNLKKNLLVLSSSLNNFCLKQTSWKFANTDRCTESVLIGRLLEVKWDSVKAFNFYMSMEHS